MMINQGHKVVAHRIVGHTNTEAMEWLQRSIVCETEGQIPLQTLYEDLVNKAGLRVIIRAVSCDKVIITFPSVMSMEDTLQEDGLLAKWFKHVNRWSKYEKAETRQVWIAVYGVPMHGWTEANFKEIAEIWGRLIQLEEKTDSTDNFESMKMLIASDHFYRIEGDVLLQIEDMGYRVFVSEIGSYPAVAKGPNHVFINQSSLKHGVAVMKDAIHKDDQRDALSNMKGNLEEGEVAQGVLEIQNSNDALSNMKGNFEGGEVAQGVLEIQNSNVKITTACLRDSPAGSNYSSSQTKALCCSHIVCSEDIINAKKGEPQHTKTFIVQEISSQGNEVEASKQNNLEDKGISDTASSEGPPPGFEHISNTAVVLNSIEGEEDQTTSEDSDIKTAKKAIQIGNLIGLKITQNEKGAEARILRSLRSSRKKEQQSPDKSGNIQKLKRRL